MAYLNAVTQGNGFIRMMPFPCKLDKNEKVLVVSTKDECARYFTMLSRHPIGRETKLYVMYDERTAMFKIGVSVNPQYRERTLQSDNPLIVMVGCWDAYKSQEKEWHERFAQHRVRGEWFQISTDDIRLMVIEMEMLEDKGKQYDMLFLEWADVKRNNGVVPKIPLLPHAECTGETEAEYIMFDGNLPPVTVL